jgi:hypothetical protein
MTSVTRWGRFEWTLQAQREYANPLVDVRLHAEFHAPDGSVRTAVGFWDGGSTWRIRFSPDQCGEWHACSACEPADAGLHGQVARFTCTPYEGENELYRHGPVGVRAGERFLRHRDGKPFFWMGDTAWNGPLKASIPDWETYLADRSDKRFNAIQFVTTQWLAAAGNADARLAYLGRDPIEIDPVFFQWLDARIDLMNDRGFLGAAVIAWAATWSKPGLALSPGTALSDDDIVRLGHYLLARYGAHHMAWILAGDGHYLGDEAARWRSIGRRVFEGTGALATIHPGGHLWLEDEFRGEPWFRFHGYQSGHWRGEEALRWIVAGPASEAWKREPGVPQINLEFCYEDHEDFDTHIRFDASDIRRDAWASLLATVPAGLTYGCHGVWSWQFEANWPMSHPKTGVARPWFEAMALPGSLAMKEIREIMESIEWWRLRPAPELLAEPRGLASGVMSPERDLAIVFSPDDSKPIVRTELLRPGLAVLQIEPVLIFKPA